MAARVGHNLVTDVDCLLFAGAPVTNSFEHAQGTIGNAQVMQFLHKWGEQV